MVRTFPKQLCNMVRTKQAYAVYSGEIHQILEQDPKGHCTICGAGDHRAIHHSKADRVFGARGGRALDYAAAARASVAAAERPHATGTPAVSATPPTLPPEWERTPPARPRLGITSLGRCRSPRRRLLRLPCPQAHHRRRALLRRTAITLCLLRQTDNQTCKRSHYGRVASTTIGAFFFRGSGCPLIGVNARMTICGRV